MNWRSPVYKNKIDHANALSKLFWRQGKSFDDSYHLILQDLNVALMQQWKKDELRKRLKGLKKVMDDMDKARKAAIVQSVSYSRLLFWRLFFITTTPKI